MTSDTATGNRPSALDRFLRAFAKVHPGEGITSLLLLANIFLLLLAYYFIKPVREGWLSVSDIAGLSKIEIKAYSAFGQSLLLIAILPLYAKLTASVPRRQVIFITGSVFVALSVIFWFLQPGKLYADVPLSGVFFYMFVGIFSVTLIAQFWSFAADIFGQERGRRLFPLVAVGASSGAVVGSLIGEKLVKGNMVDSFDLILLSIIPLALAMVLVYWIDRRGTIGAPTERTQKRWEEPAAPEGEGAFKTILGSPYLYATTVMTLLASWIIANGDNILFGMVQQALQERFNDITDPEQLKQALKTATTAFYGSLFFWINLIGLFLQAFIVSRLIQLGGFKLLILTTPLISLVAYLSMAIAPALAMIKGMKIAENSSNYSINNTARHMLWLPTPKAVLYQAKATIETLFVRIGDGLAAVTVLLGTRVWSASINDFLILNMILCVGWISVAFFISRAYRRLTAQNREAEMAPGTA